MTRVFARLSLGRKLMLGVMAPSTISLLLAVGAFFYNDYVLFREGIADDLGVTAGIMSENLNAALYFRDPESANETLAALATDPSIRGGWLYDAEGRLFAAYVREDVAPEKPFGSLHIKPFGKGLRVVEDAMGQYVPVGVEGEQVGTLYVESDLDELRERMHDYLRIAAGVFAAASLVALVLSSVIRRIIARPVVSLAHTAQRISQEKDYTLRADRFGDDELGKLGEVFNEMLDEVQHRDEALARYSRELEQEVAVRGEMQRELKKAKDAAEESSRIKSEFLSMVSHELRTPLTSVRGYARLIQKKLDTAIFPRLSENDSPIVKAKRQVSGNLDIILSEGARLTDLINDVLDLNKLDSGVVEWSMEPLDIREVVSHSADLCASLFDSPELELRLDAEENLPTLIGDRDRIIQVCINLISNAAKFTTQGEVAVVVRRTGEGDGVEVRVEDSGVGVPEEYRDAIFERFKQLGDTLTDRPAGTGLGLAICREIIDAHQGRIWVEPNPGGGSVFAFTLPVESIA